MQIDGFEFPAGKTSHIAVAKNALSKQECADIISLSKKLWDRSFERGETIFGYDESIKKTMDWTLGRFDGIEASDVEKQEAQRLDKIVFDVLSNQIFKYKAIFAGMDKWTGIMDTGYLVQFYKQQSGFYINHIDSAPWYFGEKSARVLACVIYLNDIAEGGKTLFPEHDISIKPSAGDMLLFPASWTHPHTAEMPFSDDKWIISSFVVAVRDN